MDIFKNCYKNGLNILPYIVALFISLNGYLVMAEDGTGPGPEVEITWAEVANDTYHVFYTALDTNGTTWSSKVKLSSSNNLNVAPAISSGADGYTWIAWSSVSGATSQLKFCFFDGSRWSDPEEIPTANLTSNTGVSILIDQSDRPWIVWAGFDGKDDDIYFSRWDGEVWDVPSRVHVDNDTPDILPTLIINQDNHPTVFWYGFDGEKYVKYTCRWSGHRWSNREISEGVAFKSTVTSQTSLIPSIPDFIKEPGKAVVHFRNRGPRQSIPLRELRTN